MVNTILNFHFFNLSLTPPAPHLLGFAANLDTLKILVLIFWTVSPIVSIFSTFCTYGGTGLKTYTDNSCCLDR